ncbi:hypothetical protein [Echinicola sediminis]
MRKLYIIYSLLLTMIVCCTSEHKDIEVFSTELGIEKMEALNGLIASFDQFLLAKYPELPRLSEKSTQFLLDVYRNKAISLKEIPDIERVLYKMESSGLRKDIYIYESEKDSYPGYPVDQLIPIEYPEESMLLSASQQTISLFPVFFENSPARPNNEDSLLSLKFNRKGLFMYALAKSKQEDEKYMGYIETKYKIGDIHPSLLALKHLKELSGQAPTWFERLPFIIDIYYKMLLTQEKSEDKLLSMAF